MSENLSASRSRILDADFASETASLTRAQILQQAGVAILAQANAVPQQVLGLPRLTNGQLLEGAAAKMARRGRLRKQHGHRPGRDPGEAAGGR